MTDPNKSIFLDLEVDVDLMIAQPDEFASQVYLAADKLLNILNSKTSLKGAQSEVEHTAKLDSVAKSIGKAFAADWKEDADIKAESMSLHELFHYIQATKQLVKDLELTFHTRARNEMILNSPNSVDKQMALDQYKRLRIAFDAFRDFSKLLNDKVYSPLEAKSGNYGGNEATTYPSYRYNGGVYNNYRAVARLLGWNPDDFNSHSDFTDALELQEIEVVEVIQVTL